MPIPQAQYITKSAQAHCHQYSETWTQTYRYIEKRKVQLLQHTAKTKKSAPLFHVAPVPGSGEQWGHERGEQLQ